MQNFEDYLCERNDTIDNAAYTNREIADLCGVKRKAIEKRFARIRKILSNLKEF